MNPIIIEGNLEGGASSLQSGLQSLLNVEPHSFHSLEVQGRPKAIICLNTEQWDSLVGERLSYVKRLDSLEIDSVADIARGTDLHELHKLLRAAAEESPLLELRLHVAYPSEPIGFGCKVKAVPEEDFYLCALRMIRFSRGIEHAVSKIIDLVLGPAFINLSCVLGDDSFWLFWRAKNTSGCFRREFDPIGCMIGDAEHVFPDEYLKLW